MLIYLCICELFLGHHGDEIEEELVAISSVLLIQVRNINLNLEYSFNLSLTNIDVNLLLAFQNDTKIGGTLPLKLKLCFDIQTGFS